MTQLLVLLLVSMYTLGFTDCNPGRNQTNVLDGDEARKALEIGEQHLNEGALQIQVVVRNKTSNKVNGSIAIVCTVLDKSDVGIGEGTHTVQDVWQPNETKTFEVPYKLKRQPPEAGGFSLTCALYKP